MFGASLSRISRLIAELRWFLFSRFHKGMQHPKPLAAGKLVEYAAAVQRVSGAPIIFGFLDGTVRPVCKPGLLQHPMYAAPHLIDSF